MMERRIEGKAILFKSREDPFSKNAEGISKIYLEVF